MPQMMPGGHPFPKRNVIIFLTFCVILATLVIQGLTLGPLIRLLGLARSTSPDHEEREARRIAIESALAHLDASRARDRPDLAPLYEARAEPYRQRLAGLTSGGEAVDPARERRWRDLSRELVRIERNTAIRFRDEGRIGDDVLRQIEHELDLTEAKLLDPT